MERTMAAVAVALLVTTLSFNATAQTASYHHLARIINKNWPAHTNYNGTPANWSYYPKLAGRGVHVYVIDGGIRRDHVEFSSAKVDCGRDAYCDETSGYHGTAMASLVAGKTVGVAPEVSLHVMRASGGILGGLSPSSVISAVNWVSTNGQRPAVILASLGITPRDSAVDSAFESAVAAGVVAVVAAGNESIDASLVSPAGVPSVIAVGGTGNTIPENQILNYGSVVDLLAPATSVMAATGPGTASYSQIEGTSAAAAIVAGIAAQYLEEYPFATPAEVERDLKAVATVMPGLSTPVAYSGHWTRHLFSNALGKSISAIHADSTGNYVAAGEAGIDVIVYRGSGAGIASKVQFGNRAPQSLPLAVGYRPSDHAAFVVGMFGARLPLVPSTFVGRVNLNAATGAVVWTKTLGCMFARLNALHVPKSGGGVIVAGYTMCSDIPALKSNGVDLGGGDAYVARFDDNGNIVWQFRVGSLGRDEALSVTADDTGRMVWLGGVSDGVFGGAATGGDDAFVAKMVIDSQSLAHIEPRKIGSSTSLTTERMTGLVLAKDAEGNPHLYTTIDRVRHQQLISGQTISFREILVGRRDWLSLDEQWSVVVSGSDGRIAVRASGSRRDTAGRSINGGPLLFVSGTTENTVSKLNRADNAGGKDPFFVVLDQSGNFLGGRQMGTSGDDVATGVAYVEPNVVVSSNCPGGGLVDGVAWGY